MAWTCFKGTPAAAFEFLVQRPGPLGSDFNEMAPDWLGLSPGRSGAGVITWSPHNPLERAADRDELAVLYQKQHGKGVLQETLALRGSVSTRSNSMQPLRLLS